jgi:hypothetical protein
VSRSRFAFKMKCFIFHDATRQMVARLAGHSEVCGSLSGFFLHEETKQTFVSP